MTPHRPDAAVILPDPGIDRPLRPLAPAEVLAPIVSAIFGASLDLASIQATAGGPLGAEIGEVVDRLDRVIEDLRRRVLAPPARSVAPPAGLT